MYLRRSILSLLGFSALFAGSALAGVPARSPEQALPAALPPARLGPLQIRVLRAPHVTTVEVEAESPNFCVSPGCRIHLFRDGVSQGTQTLAYTAEFEDDHSDPRTTIKSRFVILDNEDELDLRAELIDADGKVLASRELRGFFSQRSPSAEYHTGDRV